MSNERYFNLHEDRQVVIDTIADTIASCTKKGNFSGFRTKSAASSNPVFGSFNKRVTLTGTVFFCDDIAELDEIGFFTIKESTNA